MAGMTYVMVFEDIGPGHPAVQKIAKVAKVDPLMAFGALVYFWQWADKLTDDGFIPDVDEAIVDYQVRLPGFARALAEYGKGDKWLRFDGAGLHIHSYNARGGTSTKQRYKKRIQKQMERAESPDTPTPQDEPDVADSGDIPATFVANSGDVSATCSFDRDREKEITSSSASEEEADSIDDDYRPAFDAIVDAGVSYPMACLKGAQKQGHAPTSIIEVCRVYLTHAWEIGEPGHLMTRLTKVPASAEPHKNWRKTLTVPRKPPPPNLVVKEAEFYGEARKRKIPESEIPRLWQAHLAKIGGTAA